MKCKLIIPFILLLMGACFANAQYYTPYGEQNNPGRLHVYSSPLLDSILSKKYVYDSYHAGYDGYRIQIFFASGSNSKSMAYEAAESFDSLEMNIPVYISFKAPYYRVRVGDFRKKIDAEYYQRLLSGKFTGSFVVKDFISPLDKPYRSAYSFELQRVADSLELYNNGIIIAH